MNDDQQSLSSKRQHVDLAVIDPTTTTASSPSVSESAPLVSAPPLPCRPTVVRGRPPLHRSAAELQAAALRYTCSVCGKALQNAYKLDRHSRTHSGELPFACSVCEASFSDQHNARRHQRTCRARKGVEQAMRTITLSWPLWRQQPDEEGDEGQQMDGIERDAEEEAHSRTEESSASGLPRLNRWLFPQQRCGTADSGVT